MTAVRDRVQLDEQTVAGALDWYRVNRVPVAFRHLPPSALRAVRRASGGDWRRCTVDDDGSVTVHNGPVWQPSR